jgi:superfamily II DNA or RNA helicase
MASITKDILLKTDPNLKNRPYQLEALLSIFPNEKCLVKMFCGTGKSTIITNVIIHENKELNVIVFPSLALISQYSTDYLKGSYMKHFKKYKSMNISSEKVDKIESTTDPKEIKKFLKLKSPKIILVTYQSYQVLLDCLEGKKINVVCYDEAHHVTSPEYQKLVFNTDYFEKEVFFTATPRNENNITMCDRDDPEKNMCGPVAYDYTYLQGLTDGFLNAFEVCIDMFTDDQNVSHYDAMSRAILKRGTNRVLTFHSGVNGESNTNVWNFVNLLEFQKAFEKVQQAEFPEKEDYYKKITFNGMDGNTPSDVRKEMLKQLDDTPNNEIYIISSCETIGEGVDTKKANMCVFADPKTSITKIIQNIGRVVRPNKECPCSTILIPCFVDMEHYLSAYGDRVKIDELIRQQMRANNGDYAPILNVLAALKQEDPELYDMCLNYPNKQYKEKSLNEQGYRIVDESDEDIYETYSPEEVEELKEDGETPLEIHTDETIERFNDEVNDEPLKRLYYDREEEVYKPIVKMDDNESETDTDYNESDTDTSDTDTSDTDIHINDRQIIQPPNPRKQIRMSIHHNSDIEMLWGIKEELDFNTKFCSVVIECEVSYGVEKWKQKLLDVKKYIDENKKIPSDKDKNKEIKSLGSWISHQKSKYDSDINKCKEGMKNPDIYSLWNEFINDIKYKKYLVIDLVEDWKQKLLDVKEYIDENKKSPSNTDKNKEIKSLGNWISDQKKKYDSDINKCKYSMKNMEIHSLWTEFINDPKYKKYLVINRVEDWKQKLLDVKKYIDDNNKSPSTKDKNKVIKSLAIWFNHQKSNYNSDINKCKHSMKKPEIHSLWTEFINNPKYTSPNQPKIEEEVIVPKKITIKIKKQKIIRKIANVSTDVSSTEAISTSGAINTTRKFPPISKIGELHKTYLKMRSDTLHQTFKDDPELWREYHAIRKQTFANYEPLSIPANRIIQELEKIQTKRQKVVIDMGCGEASIARHFKVKNDKRFTFYNYDHQSGGDTDIQEVDISVLPLEDASVEIAIMSLALWGTTENCEQYIKQAYRVLESGGKFYISDSTKKWSPEQVTQENGGELLRTMLTTNGFKIINENIGTPFCHFECNKIY